MENIKEIIKYFLGSITQNTESFDRVGVWAQAYRIKHWYLNDWFELNKKWD